MNGVDVMVRTFAANIRDSHLNIWKKSYLFERHFHKINKKLDVLH